MWFQALIEKKTAAYGLAGIAMLIGTPNVSAGPDNNPDKMNDLTESLRPRYVVDGEMPRYSLKDRMEHYGVPGVAIGVLKDGKLIHAEGYGVLQAGSLEKITGDTLFSAGSVSKIATAALLLKMHADGDVNIDENLENYITSWQLPDDPAREQAAVTLRMLLSHTAGLNIHGFADFMPGEALPDVYQTLNGQSPASHEPLKFLFKPAVRYKYSGGGYTVAQLLATEVSDLGFPEVAREKLFNALRMDRSSFVNPLPAELGNIAKAHNRVGQPVALPQGYEVMPEMAASGLWTSARELGRLVAALIQSYRGEGGFLPKDLATDMMTNVAPSEHGLGPRVEGWGEQRFFHHGGANNSYRSWIEGHLATGDGLVVLTNGTRGSELFVEIRNAAADTFGWKINKPYRIQSLSVSQDILKSFEGIYQPDDTFPMPVRRQMTGWIYGDALEIVHSEGKLWLSRVGSDRRSELIALAPNRFLIDGFHRRIGIAELVFHRNSHKKTVALTLEHSNASSYYVPKP